jgi:hypothetical protein
MPLHSIISIDMLDHGTGFWGCTQKPDAGEMMDCQATQVKGTVEILTVRIEMPLVVTCTTRGLGIGT